MPTKRQKTHSLTFVQMDAFRCVSFLYLNFYFLNFRCIAINMMLR